MLLYGLIIGVTMDGWIKLHRQFLSWEWWDDINTSRLFLFCLLKANHEDKNWSGIEIKRGQFISSLSKIADECKLSQQQTRTSLNKLISTNEITRKATNKFTLISLVNYNKYQNINKQDNKQPNKQVTNEQQTNNKQITTTKNYKNYKELKEDNIYPQIENLEQIQNLVINFYDYQYQHYPIQLREYKTNRDKLYADSVDVIDKLIRIDGYTLDEVKLTLQSAVKDEFWRKQIISLRGLRKRSKNGSTKFDNISTRREKTLEETVNDLAKEMYLEDVQRLSEKNRINN